MAGATRLELATSGVTGLYYCYNDKYLQYLRIITYQIALGGAPWVNPVGFKPENDRIFGTVHDRSDR
jgi:hypothetical protein